MDLVALEEIRQVQIVTLRCVDLSCGTTWPRSSCCMLRRWTTARRRTALLSGCRGRDHRLPGGAGPETTTCTGGPARRSPSTVTRPPGPGCSRTPCSPPRTARPTRCGATPLSAREGRPLADRRIPGAATYEAMLSLDDLLSFRFTATLGLSGTQAFAEALAEAREDDRRAPRTSPRSRTWPRSTTTWRAASRPVCGWPGRTSGTSRTSSLRPARTPRWGWTTGHPGFNAYLRACR